VASEFDKQTGKGFYLAPYQMGVKTFLLCLSTCLTWFLCIWEINTCDL